MNKRAVVCGLIVDVDQKILLLPNERWKGEYAISTEEVDLGAESPEQVALATVRKDLNLALPNATASALGYLGTSGISGSADETRLYQYWAFQVSPGESLNVPTASTKLLSAEQIAEDTEVTWTTKHVVEKLFRQQRAVLGIITRPGRTQTEYLLLWNENYEGFFFPAARVTAEFSPATVAQSIVRRELGYFGPVVATELAEAPEVQFSPTWGRDRGYWFHIVRLELPPHHDEVMDLHRPFGPMDRHLQAAEAKLNRPDLPEGWSYRWVTGDELERVTRNDVGGPPAGGVQFTSTMAAVVPSVLAVVPPVRRELRRSEGGIAFIHGTDQYGRPAMLAQWNEEWEGFFLIGGHREKGETYEQCLRREIREELKIPDGEGDGFTVEGELEPIRYVAWSRRAEEYTDYEMYVFDVKLTPARQAAVNASASALKLRWLLPAEIAAEQTNAGQRISETVHVLTHLAR